MSKLDNGSGGKGRVLSRPRPHDTTMKHKEE